MTSPTPKAALITGAARGIGAATARSLSASGWQVALVDICADDARLPYSFATRDQLEATAVACGANAVAIVADTTDRHSIRAAVVQAEDRFGGLDALVAAAGAIAGGPPVWETSDGVWDAMISINLTGVYRLAEAGIPALLRRTEPRRGRFVAVASAAAGGGLPQLGAYSAAKHGVIGLIRSMATELASTGVTANAVSPGSTATAMLDASADIYGLDDASKFGDQAAQKRLLEPDEVAAAISWLCSEESSGITGAVIPVDAGFRH